MNVNRYASLFSLSVMLLVSGLAYGGSPKESGEPWAKYINDDRYRPVPLRDRADSVSYAAGLLVAMYKLEPLVWHYDLEKLLEGFSFSVLKRGCRAAQQQSCPSEDISNLTGMLKSGTLWDITLSGPGIVGERPMLSRPVRKLKKAADILSFLSGYFTVKNIEHYASGTSVREKVVYDAVQTGLLPIEREAALTFYESLEYLGMPADYPPQEEEMENGEDPGSDSECEYGEDTDLSEGYGPIENYREERRAGDYRAVSLWCTPWTSDWEEGVYIVEYDSLYFKFYDKELVVADNPYSGGVLAWVEEGPLIEGRPWQACACSITFFEPERAESPRLLAVDLETQEVGRSGGSLLFRLDVDAWGAVVLHRLGARPLAPVDTAEGMMPANRALKVRALDGGDLELRIDGGKKTVSLHYDARTGEFAEADGPRQKG